MPIRTEVIPFIVGGLVLAFVVGCVMRLFKARRSRAVFVGLAVGILINGYFCYFFRDFYRDSRLRNTFPEK